MKLFYSKTSPYTRRVRGALILLDQLESTELIATDPFSVPDELIAVNPLSQIPTLLTDSGDMLCGSALIVEYLDQQAGLRLAGPGQQAWQTRNLAGIAEGIIDAALAVVLEGRRPDGQQSEEKCQGHQDKILRTLDYLQQQACPETADKINYYSLTLAVALGYLDFRLPKLDWRSSCPQLAMWYTEIAQHPFMSATRPPE